jgi:branched-chain amino acid transport system ATP-binding protein
MPESTIAAAGLVVREVCVSFGGLTALGGVSLEVGSGEVVGVIGPNGAGKTTLFNVICGFVRPSSGSLSFGGRPLTRQRPHDLAGLGIARTMQSVGLWSGLTVLDNVLAATNVTAKSGLAAALLSLPRSVRDEAQRRERARAMLEELRIDDFASRFPGTLPYAVQKRVALARALVNQPALLLLDEPASGLSGDEMDELGALIRRLGERTSVVLVEHHMDLVMSVCDRVVVLDFGQVIASGSPEVVKADPAVTRAYLGEDASKSPASPFGTGTDA